MSASAHGLEIDAREAPEPSPDRGHGPPAVAPARIVIQYPSPAVDGGRYPAKRCVGDTVQFSVDIFRDGHERLQAAIRYRFTGDRRWREAGLEPVDAHHGGVRWAGAFEVDRQGTWWYDVEAWVDRFGTWQEELGRKLAAGQQDLRGELSEGVMILREIVEGVRKRDRKLIDETLAALQDESHDQSVRCQLALASELYELAESHQTRVEATRLERPLELAVDRERACFGSWYELFPRSWGGLRGVAGQVPALAELGFDVVYLPPIHPIGQTCRKGRDNAMVAAPGDPGSPWAIGDAGGGHDAVHPELGTLDDLRELVLTARRHGIEIALDFAVQCSADHPWLIEHPEWFHHRPDGTLKYVENPPKKYEDIYSVNWDSADWRGLWNALLDVVLHWVDCGITIFRVDNPHTKPFAFWAWLIEAVQRRNRDVLFLAEAFTQRAMMRQLAKIGFSQSYTYFTWKNSRWALTEYVSELALTPEHDYFRPNFFVNTPDILHADLQYGGRPAFEARLILAATLSPSYGIYSGFERLENTPARPGSEEYLHSEKYERKQRALDGPLLGMIAKLNHARRAHPALQRFANITFLETANEALIGYAKQRGGDTVITIVNLDPREAHEGLAVVPEPLGLPPVLNVRDLLSDERFQWRTGANYVRLEPGVRTAHICAVEAR
ncbi:MAG: alpha-1,4-glucan--maltose-1-phosphate maltosyltransferase [Solirubrobacteraceae bacterium]